MQKSLSVLYVALRLEYFLNKNHQVLTTAQRGRNMEKNKLRRYNMSDNRFSESIRRLKRVSLDNEI